MGISKKEALQAIEREREMICAASDAVWDHPETAFQEFKSTEILCELLEKEGFSVERNLAGIQTAFSGRFGHGKPVVGILGEFDALSGLSQESESIEKVPLKDTETVMAGSTDVGDVSWVCPTAQINAVTEAAGTPGHSWQQVSQGKSSIAHKGMLFAGKVMAGAIIDVLEDQRLIGEAKDELKKRVGEAGYVAPIPKDVRPMAINPKK